MAAAVSGGLQESGPGVGAAPEGGPLSVLNVIRSGGVALIAGGLLMILYIILQVLAGSPVDPENVMKTTFSLAFHIRVAGVLFILLGLVGLFIRHIGWIGPFGMTAFV